MDVCMHEWMDGQGRINVRVEFLCIFFWGLFGMESIIRTDAVPVAQIGT